MFRLICLAISMLFLFPNPCDAKVSDRIQSKAAYNMPSISQEKAERLIGMAYEAVHAANTRNTTELKRLFFCICGQVESLMGAKIRLEAFIDDAFDQAEKQGAYFSAYQKKQSKLYFGIYAKTSCIYPEGFLDFYGDQQDVNTSNLCKYQEYKDQTRYESNVELDCGLSLVICGGVLSLVPFPGCAGAGVWMAQVGGGMIIHACVQGCQRK